jgi:hypothetical protein
MNDYPVESYYIYNINMNFKLYNETVKRLELLLPNNKGILALNVYIL